MATWSHTKTACVRTSAWSLRFATVGHYVATNTRPEIPGLVKHCTGPSNLLSHGTRRPKAARECQIDVEMDGCSDGIING